jgi:hypothetical protein
MINNKSISFKVRLVFACLFIFSNLAFAIDVTSVVNSVSTNEEKYCTETDCFFPEKEEPTEDDVYIDGKINWDLSKNLVLQTKGNIVFKKEGEIVSAGGGSVTLKSGMLPGEKDIYDATVKFEGGLDQIKILNGGRLKIYYNPLKGKEKHKYHNPTIFSHHFSDLEPITYELVNDVYDLQGITGCLYGTYALSQDIDASPTKTWNNGKGFTPIKNIRTGSPFSGVFDGNNHIIKNLYINRPDEAMVGIFSDVTGVNDYRSLLKDLTVDNAYIVGKRCVGAVVGQATGIEILNVNVANSKISGSGGKFAKIGGCILVNKHRSVSANNTVLYLNGTKIEGGLFGSCVRCEEESADNDTKNGIE